MTSFIMDKAVGRDPFDELLDNDPEWNPVTRKTVAPKDTPMPTPNSTNHRLVQAFKADDGTTHPTLQKAIENDLSGLFQAMEDDYGGELIESRTALSAVMLQARWRQRLIKLLKELD